MVRRLEIIRVYNRRHSDMTHERYPVEEYEDDDRIRSVAARWHRWRWTPDSPTTQRGDDLDGYALWLAGGIYLLSVPAEVAYRWGGYESWLPFNPAATAVGRVLILGVLLFNAWLLDRYLSVVTPDERSLPARLLWIRRLLLALPLVRLLLMPIWLWAVREKRLHSDASGRDLPLVDLRRRVGFLDRWQLEVAGWTSALRARPEALRGWLFVTEPVLTFMMISRLMSPPRHQALGILAVLLHVLAAGGLALYSSLRLRRRTSAVCRLALLSLPLFFLLPLPWPLLGVGLWSLTDHLDHERQALTRLAYDEAGSVVRSPRWNQVWSLLRRGMKESWQGSPWRPMGQNRPSEPTVAEAAMLRLYRRKTALIAFEAAALAWLATRFAGPLEVPGWLVRTALTWTCGGLLLAVLGLGARLSKTAPLLQQLSRLSLGRYLALPPLALVLGWQLGLLLGQPNVSDLAVFLFWTGFLGFLLTAFAAVATAVTVGTPRSSDNVAVAHLLAFLSALGLGLFMMCIAPERAQLVAQALVYVVWLGLVGGLATSFTSPLDVAGGPARNVSLGLRIGRIFVATTVVLPLGGLAIPVWILLRRRLQGTVKPEGAPRPPA